MIKGRTRGSADNNGYVTAASTELSNPYGFLIYRSHLTSDAPARTFHLGRPWPAGGSTTARGQVLVRESWLGQRIKDAPWTDMSGLSWRDARLSEYRNHGPGATVNDDRPQLTSDQAAAFTPERYLAGADGWNPVRRHRPVPREPGREVLPRDDGWAATTGTTGGSLSVVNGTAITAKGSLVDGAPADVVAAFNAAHGTAIGSDAGWTPALFTRVHPPQALRALVPARAGAGRLR
ncbi:hypothetical protein ACWEPL_31875 [Nonomuraea sp. NPDC004186]